MRALSVRQPYAELILQGIKTVEYRTRPTRIVGERFYLYAAGKWPLRRKAAPPAPAWSKDLSIPGPAGTGDGVPPWMVELANGLRLFPHALPTGVIVGSAVIDRVEPGPRGMFEWHLRDVERAPTLRKPLGHPQPVWFRPF